MPGRKSKSNKANYRGQSNADQPKKENNGQSYPAVNTPPTNSWSNRADYVGSLPPPEKYDLSEQEESLLSGSDPQFMQSNIVLNEAVEMPDVRRSARLAAKRVQEQPPPSRHKRNRSELNEDEEEVPEYDFVWKEDEILAPKNRSTKRRRSSLAVEPNPDLLPAMLIPPKPSMDYIDEFDPVFLGDIPEIHSFMPDHRMKKSHGKWVKEDKWDFEFEPWPFEAEQDYNADIKAAEAEAMAVLREAEDTHELDNELRNRYWDMDSALWKLRELHLIDLGKPRARIVGKINPMFEIKVSDLEMRGASITGLARAEWKAGTITLDGHGPYKVGKNMKATHLDLNTMKGENSNVDKDQDHWMDMTPGGAPIRGSYKGDGSEKYVRGHLLNDNLGGPTNQYNLFPITHTANCQHKNSVEEYIKKGIENGYIYDYNVEITNVHETPVYKSGMTHYAVDCDLIFHFGRLTASGSIAPGTDHKGMVQSRFSSSEDVLFADSTGNYSAVDKEEEYADDFEDGKYLSDAKKVSSEYQGPSGSLPKPGKKREEGNFKKVSTFTHLPVTSALSGAAAAGGAVPQSVNASVKPIGKLYLLKNTDHPALIDRFDGASGGIVNGWDRADIGDWLTTVEGEQYKHWKKIETAAVDNGLDIVIAQAIFKTGGLGRKNTFLIGGT